MTDVFNSGFICDECLNECCGYKACDFFEENKSQKKPDKPRKTGAAYRRKMRRKKRKDRMDIMTYGYKPSAGYTDWGWEDGIFQPVGNHIQYPKNSNRQAFWKAYSNRKVRRYNGEIPKGNSYRKLLDYAWEID